MCPPPPRFRSTIALAASLFFLAPLAVQAALYLPGETLNPTCAPTDSGCGISSIVGTGTANSVPYYATTGGIVSATSTLQILSNGTASTTNIIVGNSFTLGSLSGFLKATIGAIATSLINLASDVTGILPLANGGTGLSSITGNRLLYSNSSGSALVEVATSSLSIGGNATTVTTNANLSGVITSSGNTTSFGTQNAGLLGAVINGANTSVQATSTLYGASTGGMVLGWNNSTNGIGWIATSTTGGTNYWTSALGNIYNNTGTNVGIGTTSPSQALSVQGNGLFSGNITLANLTATGTLTSNITTGTAPLAVNSTTKVANLNADLLDGFDSSAFGDATVANQTTMLTRIGTNADATTTPSASASLWAGMKYIAGNMKTNVTAMSAETVGTYSHPTAAIYCYGLSAPAEVAMDGNTTTVYTDWRLPTVGEAAVFEGTILSNNCIWTATVYTTIGVWTFVRLSDGYWSYNNSGAGYYVRCVR